MRSINGELAKLIPEPKYKLNTVGFFGASQSSGFSPSDISNLYIWFDMSNLASITKDGSDRVSNIDNLEGTSARDAVQTTAGDQPLWESSQQNSLDTVNFSGSRFMKSSSALTTVTQPQTFFTVAKWVFTTDGLILDGHGASNRINAFAHGSTDNVFSMWEGTHLSSGTVSGMLNNFKQVTIVANTTSSALRVAGSSENTGNIGTGSWDGFTLGSNNSDTVWWNDRMGEVIVYDKLLDAEEIGQVETYLADKWNVS